ncbi:hypothetical protein AUC70_08970 [Methyloceanibacter stevinii]|uniref:diguanylate cyclase n=1 Tax=Methyloceanibacter stevinii TaxID=1774970 RepID=A0A1E3VJT1_9HYPH|nr:sensor domain-containing diguanylate cyclase [Methyloceanibacter stevinii]ODR93775.1 hypothetical protein AUC70_08970 [Methyloceanibacter stevinii]
MSLSTLLKTRSLRFWTGFSLAIAILPLALSAVGGFFLLHHGVIAGFKDVSYRHHEQIAPTQRLRLSILESISPVDEYVDGAGATRPLMYRELRKRIETEFAALTKSLRAEPEAQELVRRAYEDWSKADHDAAELIARSGGNLGPGVLEKVEQFHGDVFSAVDKLSAVYDRVSQDIEKDHEVALRSYERAIWLGGIAAGVSLLTAIFGIILIGRIISGSVDRLVDGASRFAEGDRSHRINVAVPPELHRVAEEFNRMAGRVRQSEEVLADLAHRDALTRLLNRRAYDEALDEMFARAQRLGERGAVIALDVDHFKTINDTYGHAAGDEVLQGIADVMASEVRPTDKVFRTGGEEFAILLAAADITKAAETAERIRQAVKSRRFRFKDTVLDVTVSAGVAAATDRIGADKLTEAVDAALYEAKETGRDRVVVSGQSGTSQ